MSTSLVYSTVDTSIIVQLITGIIAVRGIFDELKPEHQILKSALTFEMIVQAVQFTFYVYVIKKLSIEQMATGRYWEWFFTTPVMLITSIIYYKYEEYLETYQNTNSDIDKQKLVNMTFSKFIYDNKDNIIKIVIFNFLMLLFGYLGETGQITQMNGFILGTISFIISFYIIYTNYASKSKLGTQLFTLLFGVWSIYGIAYLLNPIYKNITFNILDIIAKNFFGLFLYYKISQVKTN
jgi:bacteriorhodopsin